MPLEGSELDESETTFRAQTFDDVAGESEFVDTCGKAHWEAVSKDWAALSKTFDDIKVATPPEEIRKKIMRMEAVVLEVLPTLKRQNIVVALNNCSLAASPILGQRRTLVEDKRGYIAKLVFGGRSLKEILRD